MSFPFKTIQTGVGTLKTERPTFEMGQCGLWVSEVPVMPYHFLVNSRACRLSEVASALFCFDLFVFTFLF